MGTAVPASLWKALSNPGLWVAEFLFLTKPDPIPSGPGLNVQKHPRMHPFWSPRACTP